MEKLVRTPMRSQERPAKKRIVLVDDHPMTRLGLCQLINNEPDMEVCGEADSAEAGMDVILGTAPDLVLVDISLPGKNGLELIHDIHAVSPGIRMLVVSLHPETLYAERSLIAGSRGYVMKSESGASLLSAMRTALGGGIAVSEAVSFRVLQNLGPAKGKSSTGLEALTSREFEVFQLLGKGLTVSQIAKTLNIGIKTVHAHLSAIRPKLGISSMNELIVRAATSAASQA
jgi:DNA-binding NarL/FixJ family response regulator